MHELAKSFIAVGTQSVGGGTSTLFLLRRFLVEREARISEREFTEAWALCQLSPGIHLVASCACSASGSRAGLASSSRSRG